jgi:hypothetical protein
MSEGGCRGVVAAGVPEDVDLGSRGGNG